MSTKKIKLISYERQVTVIKEIISEVEVDVEFIKLYKFFGEKAWVLSSTCSLHLLFYLLRHMNKQTNSVYAGEKFLTAFIEESIKQGISRSYKKTSTKGYNLQTVRKSLAELTAKDFVLKLERGLYTVNFGMFYAGNETQREACIQEFFKKLPNNKRRKAINNMQTTHDKTLKINLNDN